MSTFEIDSRIRDSDGYRGTVRYIGPVAAAKNQTEHWLGIEWDKKDRGKHDGSCVDKEGKLHRYFTCTQGAGSFVKMGKVSGGRSFEAALRERYVGMDAPAFTKKDDPTLPGSFVMTTKGNAKPVEFVGEHKVRKYQQIDKVDKVAVRDDTISIIGENVADLVGHVVEIDLQDNLLHKWSELAVLTVRVPGLKTLLLHGNRMQAVTPSVTAALPNLCFEGLRTLALNACGITSWSSIQLLGPLLPCLEELYLSANCLSDLPQAEKEDTVFAMPSSSSSLAASTYVAPEGTWTDLRVLDVSGCGIESWSQMYYFAQLPSLQEVLLDGNPLDTVSLCPVDGFKCLTRISISSTNLGNWSSIDALATYPELTSVRLSHIPLFSGKGASEVRPYVIGRVSALVFFNGSTVHPRERMDAEKIYLRSIMRDGEAASKAGRPYSDSALLALHPRHTELQEKHGADLTPVRNEGGGGNIASELLKITFNNMSFAGGASNEPLVKKLPVSITVEKLKVMVQQLFNLEPALQLLSIQSYKDSPPSLLEDDYATLGYYGVQNGANIYINESKGEMSS